MDGNSLVIWMIVGFVGFVFLVGIGIVAFFLFARKRFRQLENLPVTRISEAPDGAVVKIKGMVAAAEQLLTDPITGRECVVYRAWVSCASTQGLGPRRNWSQVKLAESKEQTDFLVEDVSGSARVKVPQVMLGFSITGATDGHHIDQFLADAGVKRPEKEIFPGGQAIRVGDSIVVVGQARRVSEGPTDQSLIIEPRACGTVWVTDRVQKT